MSPKKPRRWRKDFPYYKIQVFNKIFNAWQDEPRAYSTVEDARAVMKTRLSGHTTRIMVVEHNSRHVLEE